MKFSELTDGQWEFMQPHLPPPARTGRARNDDRRTVNGILYVLVTGCRWMDMPERYGSHKSAWERHKKWSEDGTWKRSSWFGVACKLFSVSGSFSREPS